MARNRLAGSRIAEFLPDDGGAPIALHRYLGTIQDTLKPRLAVHEFLKVDGAEIEWMGNSPDTYRFTIAFVGADGAILGTGSEWLDLYRALDARLKRSPKGLLTHPVFGSVRVACQGLDNTSIDVAQAVDSITIPISFISDEIDTRRTGEAPTVSLRVSDIAEAVASLAEYAAPFASAATAIAALVSSATTLGEAAAASSQDSTADEALDTKLGTVRDNCETAIAALEADPANEDPADTYQAVSQCEIVHALCVEVVEAYRDSKPPLSEYTVPGDLDVLALASLLYGPDAQARVEELLALNRIPNPYRIPAGTVLTISSPTLI